jgi:hypothetical protein
VVADQLLRFHFHENVTSISNQFDSTDINIARKETENQIKSTSVIWVGQNHGEEHETR